VGRKGGREGWMEGKDVRERKKECSPVAEYPRPSGTWVGPASVCLWDVMSARTVTVEYKLQPARWCLSRAARGCGEYLSTASPEIFKDDSGVKWDLMGIFFFRDRLMPFSPDIFALHEVLLLWSLTHNGCRDTFSFDLCFSVCFTVYWLGSRGRRSGSPLTRLYRTLPLTLTSPVQIFPLNLPRFRTQSGPTSNLQVLGGGAEALRLVRLLKLVSPRKKEKRKKKEKKKKSCDPRTTTVLRITTIFKARPPFFFLLLLFFYNYNTCIIIIIVKFL